MDRNRKSETVKWRCIACLSVSEHAMIIYIWQDAVIDMNKRKIDYMVIDMKVCDDMICYDLSDLL